MNTGILLIALGNEYYGKLAYNLILSIRKNSNIPITIYANGNALNYLNENISTFDIVELPKEYYNNNKVSLCNIKTSLNVLSPYDKTLYLDVDSIIFNNRKIDQIISDLDGNSFVSQSIPLTDKYYNEKSIMHQATLSDVQKVFDIDEPKAVVNSFFVYWEKSEYSDHIFNRANEIYKQLLDKKIDLSFTHWYSDIPDELCLTISLTELNHEQLSILYQPLYTPRKEDINRDKIKSIYQGMTLPDNINNLDLVRFYLDEVNPLLINDKKETFLFKQKNYFDFNSKKKINLLTQQFNSPFEERNGELSFCLFKNLNNPLIDKIYVWVEEGSQVPFKNDKIVEMPLKGRATYKLYLDYANNNLIGDICIIANTDIYFDRTLDYISDFNMIDKFFICLSKQNIKENENPELSPDHVTSQDSQIFSSPCNIPNNNIELGQPGCDCRIAYEAEMSGYITNNPAYLIRTYHLHLNQKSRTQSLNKDMIRGGHLKLKPTYNLTQISEKNISFV